MKRSLTDNRDMTFDEFIRLFVYRPYGDELKYMVDSDERIHIKGDTWLCILDHKTGDFSFSGELHKYYSIDTIESIRDCFGDIYSIFNLKYDEVKRDIWMTIGDIPDIVSDGYRKQYADEEKKRIMLQKKRDYYWAHREQIRKRRNIHKK
jgi:hypothetical protein